MKSFRFFPVRLYFPTVLIKVVTLGGSNLV